MRKCGVDLKNIGTPNFIASVEKTVRENGKCLCYFKKTPEFMSFNNSKTSFKCHSLFFLIINSLFSGFLSIGSIKRDYALLQCHIVVYLGQYKCLLSTFKYVLYLFRTSFETRYMFIESFLLSVY